MRPAFGSAIAFLVGVTLLVACTAPAALPVATPAGATQIARVETPVRVDATATRGAAQTVQAEAFANPAPVGAPSPTATERAATPTATTQEPTSAPAEAAAARQVALQEELFLAGAPAFAIVNICPMPDDLAAGQRAATWTAALDSGLLCLFGYGENETVRYEVWDAAGEMVESSEGVRDNIDGDPLPSVKAIVYIADRAPGEWRVEAMGASGELSATFAVQPLTEAGEPAVVLAFEVPLTGLALGDEINIAAYGLPPNAAPQLGVYEVVSKSFAQTQLRLHESGTLEADDGAAFVTLILDPTYQPGEYCAVLHATPAYEPTYELSATGATRCFEVMK